MNYRPGMAVALGGALLRIIKVVEHDYLNEPYFELLVVHEEEDAKTFYVMPQYVTPIDDDPVNLAYASYDRENP